MKTQEKRGGAQETKRPLQPLPRSEAGPSSSACTRSLGPPPSRRAGRVTLEVLETVALRFKGGPTAAGDYILSPFVYAGGHEIVVRAVPRLDS